MNDLENLNEFYRRQIGKNIKRICVEKGFTQNQIVERCIQAGYNITQGTISNAEMGRSNLTLSTLLAISSVLEIDIADLFKVTPTRNGEIVSNIDNLSSNELFVCNPKSKLFKGYLGTYHIAFFKTSGFRGKIDEPGGIIKGTLSIKENDDKTKCEAILKFEVDEIDSNTGDTAEKTYHGEVFISQSARAVFCYLVNERVGEMCMLIFQYIFTSFRKIETAMAAAITTASGSNRRPTMHRMCISRTPISDEAMPYVQGQLLMNNSDIYITDKKFVDILKNKSFPDSFKKLLEDAVDKEKCYRIFESDLYDRSLSEDEQRKYISLVRTYSEAWTYHKISRYTDEALYDILNTKQNDHRPI